MSNQNVSNLLNRLAAAEREFWNQEFMAPAVRGGTVQVRIAGVVMRMKIEPAEFQGWGVFLPITHDTAMLVRQATLAERRRYLQLTMQTSLILCDRRDGVWSAVSSQSRGRLQIDAAVPVQLVEAAETFDIVNVGFDGANFWFDRVDSRADSATTAWLRSSIGDSIEPMQLQRKGLTAQQRVAYALHYAARIKSVKQSRRDRVENQLCQALEHAGAKLEGYVEHQDGFRVTYSVGGQRRVSSVNKDDLTVQVAGICLSGQDRKFDLASLVGVMNESNSHYAVRVGDDGISVEDYWDTHPPEW